MPTRRQFIASVTAVVCLGVGATLAGCTDGTSVAADQPTGPDSSFVAGDFTSIPKPGDAAPLGDPSVDGTTTTQSFFVNGIGPADVLAFYESALGAAGWTLDTTPAETGDGDWQGEWSLNDERLQVSASPSPGNGLTTQLDLVLIQ